MRIYLKKLIWFFEYLWKRFIGDFPVYTFPLTSSEKLYNAVTSCIERPGGVQVYLFTQCPKKLPSDADIMILLKGGRSGRVIVKHSFGGTSALKPEQLRCLYYLDPFDYIQLKTFEREQRLNWLVGLEPETSKKQFEDKLIEEVVIPMYIEFLEN